MRRTITWILYSFMGVQIAFGCVYFVTNFLMEQQFAENMIFFLPAGAVYLLQLVLAAVSTWYVLGKTGSWENRYEKGYVCAFLLTVPFLLQMHMARLPWSLSLSAFLWLTGLVMEIRESGISRKNGIWLLISYFCYGIVCPDGLWIGGILILLASVFYWKKQGKWRFRLAVLLIACVIFAVNMGLNSALPEQRTIYRENNPGTAAVSRFVWPNFATNYFFWSDEIKAVLPENEAVNISERVDLLEKEFYPLMKETYGSAKATKLCLEMGYRCLMDRSKETVLEIGRDLKDYLLIPFTIERNLQGEGASLTAWNYGRMKAHTPLLVKYYYRYGLFELPVLLLGSLLLWSLQRSDRISQWTKQRLKDEEIKDEFNKTMGNRGLSAQWKLLLAAAVWYVLWYTMKSNLPIDYKLVLPVLFVWYLASVSGTGAKRQKEQAKRG